MSGSSIRREVAHVSCAVLTATRQSRSCSVLLHTELTGRLCKLRSDVGLDGAVARGRRMATAAAAQVRHGRHGSRRGGSSAHRRAAQRVESASEALLGVARRARAPRGGPPVRQRLHCDSDFQVRLSQHFG